MKEVIDRISAEDFLAVIPSPSRSLVSGQESTQSLLAFAQYLSSQPGNGLSTKGGAAWPRDLFANVLKEVQLFICTDNPKYEPERQKLKKDGAPLAKAVVFTIAVAAAPTIGVAPALLIPLVAVIMSAIAKITVTAWCVSMAPVQPTQQAPADPGSKPK